MVNDSKAFLDEVAGYVTSPEAVNRLGTIDAAYTSGRPRVLFDGETVLGAKTYPYLAAYAPRAGERVLLAPMGSGFVVLGAIDAIDATASPAYTWGTGLAPNGVQTIIRRGGLVYANFRVTASAAIAAGGTLATLPAGYRPATTGQDVIFAGGITVAGSWTVSLFYVSHVDGTVHILGSSLSSGQDASAFIPAFPAGA